MLAPDQARKNSWGTPQSSVTGMPSVLLFLKLLEQGTGALQIYISFVTLSSSGNPFLQSALKIVKFLLCMKITKEMKPCSEGYRLNEQSGFPK
jgi:hypothetical protein